MALQNRSALIGWCLIAACVLAIPVGLMARSGQSTEHKDSETESPLRVFKSDRIQVIKLSGVIADTSESSTFFSSELSADGVRRKLRKAIKDDHVKAILLRVNSPGGTVGTSQEIYDTLLELRSKGKPVVVSMGDVAASGGYYVASAADRIFANPGTLTGSIGVIMHLLNWQETEKKIGLMPNVIKSGAFKDIGSPDRPMTPAEHELLQALIMDSYDQFVTAVSKGRKIPKEQIKVLADGRIYSGQQALKNKLIDELGGYDAALAWLQKDCREKYHLSKDLEVDEGNRSSEILSSLFESMSKTNLFGGQARSVLKDVLPVSMDPAYNKVPLWLME